MLYCVDNYKKDEDKVIEVLNYTDKGGEEWVVRRTDEGFFIFYKGNPARSAPFFEVDTKKKKQVQINNTNIYLVLNSDFYTFYMLRNIILNYETEEVFQKICDLMQRYRFSHSDTLMKSEERK